MNTPIEPIPWRGFRAHEKVIILLLPWPAIAVLLLPLLDVALLRRLARQPGLRPFVTWLINDGGSWILGGALLLVAVVILWWLRHRLLNDKRLWYGTGCPACRERELVRVSRHFGDRFYSLIRVPAYRYACRNCTWRGLRIARREHTRQTEAELEAALLRFDPDALPDAVARRPGPMFRDPGDVAILDAAHLDGPNATAAVASAAVYTMLPNVAEGPNPSAAELLTPLRMAETAPLETVATEELDPLDDVSFAVDDLMPDDALPDDDQLSDDELALTEDEAASVDDEPAPADDKPASTASRLTFTPQPPPATTPNGVPEDLAWIWQEAEDGA